MGREERDKAGRSVAASSEPRRGFHLNAGSAAPMWVALERGGAQLPSWGDSALSRAEGDGGQREAASGQHDSTAHRDCKVGGNWPPSCCGTVGVSDIHVRGRDLPDGAERGQEATALPELWRV